MAKQERPRRGAGRNTPFGKRQKADDEFRGKKKERRADGDAKNSFRPRRSGTGGSSYGGGKRTFTPGGPSERRSFGKPPFEKRSDDGGEKKPFAKRSYGKRSDDGGEKRSFGKRPYEKRSEGSGEKRSFGKRPYQKRSDDGGGEKRSFGKRPYEKKSFDKKPFDKKPFEKRPFRKRDDRKDDRPSFVESKVNSHRERVQHEEPAPKPGVHVTDKDGLIRLNKFISNSGVCSRREADDLIKLGVITVNGVTITEMGHKVKPTDDVRHDGKKLTAEKPVYILLNKPKGFITTTEDPQERNTVMELIAGACKERVYPVGRLDRNTTGLLLLTNDGDLTDKLTHPSYNAKKIYKVELDRVLSKDDFQKIIDGVQLEEGKALVDDLAVVSDDGKTVGIELHIGWNHVVRRIFDALQYDVIKLDRVVYAGLDKKDLKRGQWRFLKNDEIVRLKHFK